MAECLSVGLTFQSSHNRIVPQRWERGGIFPLYSTRIFVLRLLGQISVEQRLTRGPYGAA